MFTAIWKPDVGYFRKKDAQKVADEIFSIGENPTNHDIVEKARNENSYMHDMFEWRDEVAAEKYRETQAHQIISCLYITKMDETVTEIKKPIRLMHNISGEEGYRPIQVILNNEDMYTKLLEQAKSDLISFKTKYSILKELAPVFDAIEQIAM